MAKDDNSDIRTTNHGFDNPDLPDTLTKKDKTDLPFSPLIGDIFTQMFKDSASTTNRLVDSLQYQNNYLRAQLDIIRETVADLADSDMLVNPRLYLKALHPSEKAIEQVMQNNSDIGL